MPAPVSAAPPAARIDAGSPPLVAVHPRWIGETLAGLVVMASAVAWFVLFSGLALGRHAAGGTSAEDLGFTDQVIWNLLQGRWFEMSVYEGGTWNTEINIAAIRHPDSLLAFHVEPMLLLLVPFYAVGADSRALLVIQAASLAIGALPAYVLGRRWTCSVLAGVAVAVAYLLSPLLQWVVMSDFHTTALAVPLLLFAVERFAAGRPVHAVGSALLALTAREDVALSVAGLGVWAALHGHPRSGLPLSGIGFAWALGSVFGIIGVFTGGIIPFAARYEGVLREPDRVLQLLGRPEVQDYVSTLVLNGGWLGIFAPLALLPAMPSLFLNLLSASPWMASGKGHYSALVLPFLTVSSAAGVAWLKLWLERRCGTRAARLPGRVVRWAAAGLVTTAVVAHASGGMGQMGAYASPVVVEPHGEQAASIAAEIPRHAAVSASAALFPRVSQRERIYVFPAVSDAEYVFLDVTASAAPISAGGVMLRVQGLLSEGGWVVERAVDGLLLLTRRPEAAASDVSQIPPSFYTFAKRNSSSSEAAGFGTGSPLQSYRNGALDLVSAEFRPQPAGALSPWEPRGALRTTWRANHPLAEGDSLVFSFAREGREAEHHAELATLLWYPPHRWKVGELVCVEVLNVPLGARWWVTFDGDELS
jgi:uncharacterized membrane protein